MQIGMLGLGRMGSNLSHRLLRSGHQVVAYDLDSAAVAAVAAGGGVGVDSLDGLIRGLDPPRSVWVMIPAAITGGVIGDLSARMEPGDIVIDGGNSFHRHDHERAQTLAEAGIRFVDVGTSGGLYGLERGFCLMIGGEPEVVAHLDPIFRALAPGVDAVPRTGGGGAIPAPAEHGYLHCGPAGAGHFVKMIHNGIEYGMMASLAEGMAVLADAGAGLTPPPADAETAPLDDASAYRYRFDLPAVAEVWRRGSVVSSWLLDITAQALQRDPDLSEFEGRVSDSGEGRWTVQAAVDLGVPIHAITAALYERFASRGEADYADRLLSAMRREFGGHLEQA